MHTLAAALRWIPDTPSRQGGQHTRNRPTAVRTRGTRKRMPRAGRAASPLLGLTARRRGFTLALVLLPVPRLTGSGAVASFLAAAAQMRRSLTATTRADRHRRID